MTSSEEKKECAREFCSFSAPLKDWKIKTGGVPGKWCEHCCDVAVKKSERVKGIKKTIHGNLLSKKIMMNGMVSLG